MDVHTMRVGREARKVLRLASWVVRERCRGAMDGHEREVKRWNTGPSRRSVSLRCCGARWGGPARRLVRGYSGRLPTRSL